LQLLRNARGALRRMILRISVRQCHPEGTHRFTRYAENSAIIVIRARTREQWCVAYREKKKARKRIADREDDGRCCSVTIGWLVVGGRSAAAIVVVGGGGGGGGGCSGFRECPRKTSAASHHGEPTEIQ